MRKSSPNIDHNAAVHHAALPANVYRGEDLKAVLTDRDSGEKAEVRIWRLSPFGLEVVDDTSRFLFKGRAYDIALSHRGETITEHACVVEDHLEASDGMKLAAFRFFREVPRATESRGVERWQCDEEYAPTVYGANPLRFNDRFFGRLIDLSKAGFLMRTSLRNKHIVPGMTLSLEAMFPVSGQASVKAKVTDVRTSVDTDDLLVHAKLIDPSPAFVTVAGDYLMHFGRSGGNAPTWQQLRDAGFALTISAKNIDFSFVQTEAEYHEVLELRRMAYDVIVPHLNLNATDWADAFDGRARILIGRYRGRIVASLRLVFHDDDDTLEAASLLSLPEGLPKNSQLVECGRACTHPDYRGADLLLSLFRYVVLTCLEVQRPTVLLNCNQNIYNIYRNIGGRKVAEFTHSHDGQQHYLLIIDLARVINGQGVTPLQWSVFIGDIFDSVRKMYPGPSTLLGRLKLQVYRWLHPLMSMLARRKPRRARRDSLP